MKTDVDALLRKLAKEGPPLDPSEPIPDDLVCDVIVRRDRNGRLVQERGPAYRRSTGEPYRPKPNRR